MGEYGDGVCQICGAKTYGNSIGCGCQKIYKKATFAVLSSKSKESLEYNFSIEMRVKMTEAQKRFKEDLAKHGGDLNKTFRTDFNRSFFPSVFEFFTKKGYVSKKQLSIVEKKYFDFDNDLSRSTDEKILREKEEFLSVFAQKNSAEITKTAIIFYQMKKNNKM